MESYSEIQSSNAHLNMLVEKQLSGFGVWQLGINSMMWLITMTFPIEALIDTFTGWTTHYCPLDKNVIMDKNVILDKWKNTGSCFCSLAIPGYEPDQFMRKLSECPNTQDYLSLMSQKHLFGVDQNGATDYCKMRPLKEQRTLGTSGTNQTACKWTDFDLSIEPSDSYNDPQESFVYAPFLMEDSFATEFGLVCEEKYKVRSAN